MNHRFLPPGYRYAGTMDFMRNRGQMLAVVKLARQLIFGRKDKDPLMAYAASAIAVVSAAILLFTSVNAAWLVVAGALAGLAVSLCRRPAPAKEEGK